MTTHLPSSFKQYLQQSGYSVSIQNMLPACIAEFMQYGRFTGLESITATSIRLFYDHLHVRPLKRKVGGLSAMMISHYVYALKVFFEWQEVSGLLDHNPMSGLKFRRARPNSRDPLTIAEVQSLFGAAMCPKEQVMLHLFLQLRVETQ